MKKIVLFSFMMLLIFGLIACSDKDEVSNNVSSKHDFKEFSLDVDYSATESYEASYDQDKDGLEASIEDYRTKETLKGDMAFEKLNPILESLKFDSTTPDADVISEILEAFGLDSNYKEFDLDVTFNNGTKVEYKNIQ